jgi:hypothetical protein
VVRPLRTDDFALIRKWHAESGFRYPLPDFDSPLCAVLGVSEERGKVHAAGIVRLIGESYLFLNPETRPGQQVRAALELQEALELDARAVLGLDHLICALPPNVNKPFLGQIARLGWQKSTWKRYAKNI